MIYDCVTYFQEPDLLELRMLELDGWVDRFVVVEGNRTHAGAPRTSSIPQALRDRWGDRLVTAMIDLPEGDGPTWTWRREMGQRNGIRDVLRALGAAPDDMVLVSDVDELPNQFFMSILSQLPPDAVAVAHQQLHYYDVNHVSPGGWRGTRATQFANLDVLGADGVRYAGTERGGFPRILEVPHAGWHFSYFGGLRRIQTKITSFLHQEFNLPEHVDMSTIHKRVQAGDDVYGRPEQSFRVGPVDYPLPFAMYARPGAWNHFFYHQYRPNFWASLPPRLDDQVVFDVQSRIVHDAPKDLPIVIVGDVGARLTIAVASVAGSRPVMVDAKYKASQAKKTRWNIQAYGLGDRVQMRGLPTYHETIGALILDDDEGYPTPYLQRRLDPNGFVVNVR